MYDYLVVGAGLAGSTIAERLATQLGASVLVIDKRPHVAGNTHDPVDADGLRYHQYGPHIFHTNSAEVVAYLSAFTAWRPYEHRVLARAGDRLVPIPINRTTINTLYGLDLDAAAVARFLADRAVPFARIENSEQMIVSRVGRELYETFFRGYTRKHWGLDPAELDASVCGRIPTRTGDDDRYFTDAFQAMPAEGYTAMVERMLASPEIDVVLGTDFAAIADRARFGHVIYTGPIDEYFDCKFGRLPYRSLRFEFETRDVGYVQPVGCINEPAIDVAHTRTTEYKHLTGQTLAKTILSREYPSAEGDPYYPIPRPENRELYRKYANLARAQRAVTFVGRLAEYRYYNMDQVVASALATFEDLASTAAAAS
ncbi:UDP-galactopyranose mutase [Vulcanimicrobium alpinum]|uniref:UDP-galactopyranose mutase n=1 Tax=Vulcanimicrobium alpinum TaxID=3016050 RepID=A0AAN2CAJ6_UNVUL|nr:UDP-galactopyranose mutase [Vulcanimicrobium alpinum]BDE07424.1 UDP-galactopyranose mutase [Vulcanimicrobium alpinum]